MAGVGLEPVVRLFAYGILAVAIVALVLAFMSATAKTGLELLYFGVAVLCIVVFAVISLVKHLT